MKLHSDYLVRNRTSDHFYRVVKNVTATSTHPRYHITLLTYK